MIVRSRAPLYGAEELRTTPYTPSELYWSGMRDHGNNLKHVLNPHMSLLGTKSDRALRLKLWPSGP